MKNINEIPFVPTQQYFLHIVQAYIHTYQHNYLKNHTFLFFWKKNGIERAQDILHSINMAHTVKDLLSIVLNEEDQGIDLSKILNDFIIRIFAVSAEAINTEAQNNHTLPEVKAKHRPYREYEAPQGVNHPETQTRAKKAIVLKIIKHHLPINEMNL